MSASRTPLPYRATARVDEVLVAESSAAIRVDEPNAAPQVWFPRGDVGRRGAAYAGSVKSMWTRLSVEDAIRHSPPTLA